MGKILKSDVTFAKNDLNGKGMDRLNRPVKRCRRRVSFTAGEPGRRSIMIPKTSRLIAMKIGKAPADRRFSRAL